MAIEETELSDFRQQALKLAEHIRESTGPVDQFQRSPLLELRKHPPDERLKAIARALSQVVRTIDDYLPR